MASHKIRVLCESKNTSFSIADSITEEPLFWWRGNDLTIDLALSDNGVFLTSSDIGSITVAIKALNADADDAVAMIEVLGSGDCDAGFTSAQWQAQTGALCSASWTRAEAALDAGSYVIVVSHDDGAGKRNTYLHSQIVVKEDQHDSVSLSSPPAPATEYYSKEEDDLRFAPIANKTVIAQKIDISVLAAGDQVRDSLSLVDFIARGKFCYFMDEASGSFLDKLSGLDLAINGTPSASASGGRFGEAVTFDGDGDFGESAVDTNRNGGPFWVVVGANFDSVANGDGIIGEGNVSDTTAANWSLWRNGDKITFTVRRAFGATFSVSDVAVLTEGLTVSTDYVIVARCDTTGLYLYVSELGEIYDNASLVTSVSGADTVNYPLTLGRAFNSSASGYYSMDGAIGFAAVGHGQMSERIVDKFLSAGSDEFSEIKTKLATRLNRYNGIFAVGDSLTTEGFADPNWSERAAVAHNSTWRAEVSGVSGQTSTPITARFLSYPLSNISRRVVAIWIGNNNQSAQQVVIDDARDCAHRALIAGAEKIFILGLPNRTVSSSWAALSTQAKADFVAEQDFINAGFLALAATHEKFEYLDLTGWFGAEANYATAGYTLTSDDQLDIAAGLVPRGLRDSPTGTHLGDDGADFLAYYVTARLNAAFP